MKNWLALCLLFISTNGGLPLFGQRGIAEIETLQDARFPSEVSSAIQYASEKGITVRFALMSEVFELMDYNSTEVFPENDLNLPINQLIGIYYESHKNFLPADCKILPFAVSINHYHEDKADFLAVVRSPSPKRNGRILYTNLDNVDIFPAFVAPDFTTLLPDFKARVDAAHEAGKREVFFRLSDSFTQHTFEVELDTTHEKISVSAPVITALDKEVSPRMSSQLQILRPQGGAQTILMNLSLSIGKHHISQDFRISDFLRRKIRHEFIYQYIVSLEYRRMYSLYIWCANRFLKTLSDKGIAYEEYLSTVSLSTTFRHAIWKQGESTASAKRSDFEGRLLFDKKVFQFTLGEDKTKVEDADEDRYYETFVEGVAPKWVNGIHDDLKVKVIGLHRDKEHFGWYDLICEIEADKYDPGNNGCIIYIQSFAPYRSQEHNTGTSRKIYSSVADLLAENRFLSDRENDLLDRSLEVEGAMVELYRTKNVGRKRYLPFLEITIEPTPKEHFVELDYQFGFERYQKMFKIVKGKEIRREELFATISAVLDELEKQDEALKVLRQSLDEAQLMNLGYFR